MPASVSEYVAGCPRVASSRGEQARRDEPLEPAAEDVGRDSLLRAWSSSRKWRRLPEITSRSTSIDHGSPSTSMAALIAHPDPGGR